MSGRRSRRSTMFFGGFWVPRTEKRALTVFRSSVRQRRRRTARAPSRSPRTPPARAGAPSGSGCSQVAASLSFPITPRGLAPFRPCVRAARRAAQNAPGSLRASRPSDNRIVRVDERPGRRSTVPGGTERGTRTTSDHLGGGWPVLGGRRGHGGEGGGPRAGADVRQDGRADPGQRRGPDPGARRRATGSSTWPAPAPWCRSVRWSIRPPAGSGSPRPTRARSRRSSRPASSSAGSSASSRAGARGGLVNLVLRDNLTRLACGSGGGARHAAFNQRVLGLLRGTAKGRFRTTGRFAAATVRGTDWGVRDRCDGTLTVVRDGRRAS